MSADDAVVPPELRRVPGRARSLLLLLVVVVVVATLTLWATEPQWSSKSSPSTTETFVVVTSAFWQFVGAEGCWPNATTGGTTLLAGAVWPTGIDLAYSLPGPTACVVRAVGISTVGFGLLNDSAPVTVPGSGTGWLWANVSLPAIAFQGQLDLFVFVSNLGAGP